MTNKKRYPFFTVPGASWRLTFAAETVTFLESHIQRKRFQKEAVGQLFTKSLIDWTVVVELATYLKPKKATWARVSFDPDAAMAQREALLRDGLFCIGLWHTHPEPKPEPSGTDETLAADHARAARNVLSGLVFIIIGNKPYPAGWYVSIHDGQRFHRAELELG